MDFIRSTNNRMSIGSPERSSISLRRLSEMPSGAKYIFRLLATPAITISRERASFRWSRCSATCFRSVLPMSPVPTRKTESVLTSDRKNAWCKAFIALPRSCFRMTVEMFSSEEPWAVATTLIPFFPSAPKSRAETPGVFFMFSPITAITLRPSSTFTCSMRWSRISNRNASSIAAFACAASPGRTAKVIVCSELPWVIRMTFTFD